MMTWLSTLCELITIETNHYAAQKTGSKLLIALVQGLLVMKYRVAWVLLFL